MKRVIFIAMTALALLTGIGCKKHGSSNQQGTMSCLINGGPWVASPTTATVNSPVAFTYGDTVFIVNGQDTGFYYKHIVIRVASDQPGFAVGVPIPLNGYNTPVSLSYITDSSCLGTSGINVVSNVATSGTITINKLDTLSREVTGIFSASIPITPCDTIKITAGRFDRYFIME